MTKNVNTDEQIRMYAKVNTAAAKVLTLSRIVMLMETLCSPSVRPLYTHCEERDEEAWKRP